MATRLLAPSFGEGVEELTVTNWLKKEGDTVKELEVIVELETDKVTTEIPSPASGVLLKTLAKKDEVVKVGSTLAWIGQPGEVLDTAEPAKTPSIPAVAAKPTPEVPKPVQIESTYTGRISPLVKKLVAENDVDLNLVHGTGLDGRITKEDVLKYLETRKPGPPGTIAQKPGAAVSADLQPVIKPSSLAGELVPISSLRKQIAERMVASQHTSPHVLTVMEADLSKVLLHRAANKASFAAQGIDLTLTVYFCSAIISGLEACPYVNSSWTEEGILQYKTINLGVATSLGDLGLIVPVIKDAGRLSLQGLAEKINDLSARARTKKLLPEEVKDGTFTLTNYGSGGSLFASPIIYQPQVAILGTGMMQKRAVVVTDTSGNDAITIRPMVYLSLVFDHRIMDGAGGDRFLKVVKETLENWC